MQWSLALVLLSLPRKCPEGSVLQFYSGEATAIALASTQAPWGNWQRSRAFLSGRRVLSNLGRGSCHVARARLGLRASSVTLGQPLHLSVRQFSSCETGVLMMPTSGLAVQMKG